MGTTMCRNTGPRGNAAAEIEEANGLQVDLEHDEPEQADVTCVRRERILIYCQHWDILALY